jgi:hypothetical protein
MSLASDLIDKVQRTGAKFELTPTGFNVLCAPGSVPQEFQSDLRQHKPEIISYLIQRRYEPVYPHQDQREDELKELVRRVEEEGYVLLWCEVLRDLVAFHRDDVDPATIPAPFVPYSDDELRHLFGEDGSEPSPDGLRLIHAAKKTGAIITNRRKEGSGPGNA